MWVIKRIMGTTNSTYLDELSDDSSDESEFDYSLEPRNDNRMNFNEDSVQNLVTTAAETIDLIEDKDINDVTTDAFVKSFPKPDLAITLDGVFEIEKELEEYEMVSLVYLLYADPNYALQELTLYLKGAKKNLLYNWATVEESISNPWQKKLIEALCVIKNYEVLRTLGYSKSYLVDHYLPHLPTALTNLNKTKKAIYLLCEKLNREKTDTFLTIVEQHFQEKNLPFEKYDSEFLEMYFFYWESKKYITMSDLNNVKRALKVMEEEALYDMLDDALATSTKNEGDVVSEVRKTIKVEEHSPKTRMRGTDAHQRASTSRQESQEFSSSPASIGRDNSRNMEGIDDDSHIYKIDPDNPGVALIINEEEFYTEFDEAFVHLLPEDIKENKLESRLGTQRDKQDLINTFSKFGYTVKVAENLTHEELIAEVKTVVKSVRHESSLFVCILSHGDKGIVYGSNSCKVKVSEIQEIMCKINKENLTGKPKVLILQSCQGKSCQKLDESSEEESENCGVTTDGPNNSKPSGPRIVDMLTFWATVPGYAAIRNKRTGSWFIQALVKKMTELGNKIHFEDICTRILNDVSNKTWIADCEKNAMTPMKVSTLRKDFYLPPMRSN